MTVTEPAATVAPHNLDAEEHVLGAILLGPAALETVRAILDPADFYRDSHGRIYRAALSLHELGQPVDGITVAARLRDLDQLADAGGPERVHELAALTPAVSNVAHHARLIVADARRRGYITAAEQIARLAREAGDLDLLADQARELLHDERAPTAAHRVAGLTDFLAVTEDAGEALTGEPGETLLPAGGLVIVGGEGGASKTTLTLDAIAHLASGTPWLGYPVARPVRVLIVENEGPRPQFRAKIADKVDSWQGAPFAANVHVWEEPWAQFTFADPGLRRALVDTARDLELDLVVADPLDSLGVIGAGTPEDVRVFIGWLKECGLHNPDRPLAFWLLHHFNKTGHRSVVQQLSGAWGGHPDAIIGVELGDAQTTKLTWGKLRHATPPANRTWILSWDTATRGFHPLERPEPIAADELENLVLTYVNEHAGAGKTVVVEALHDDRRPRARIRAAIDRLTEQDQLAVGPGPSPSGKYLYPASHLNLPLAEPLFADTASTEEEVNLPPDTASDGKYGKSTPDPSQAQQLAASSPAPPKGGPGSGRFAETATNGQLADHLPRTAEAEAWIDQRGWMLDRDDLAAQLLDRWPSLGAHDLASLIDRAEARAEAEA